MDNQKIRNSYMYALALIGAAVAVTCVYRLPLSVLDLRFAVLALLTVLVGSRITIKIPGAKGQISVSDTFVFLAMLMGGVESAVVLAAVEALCSSIRFTRKAKVLLFNVGVMALSTFLTASLVYALVPELSSHLGFTPRLIIALCVMALAQYALNSGLIAVSVALGTGETVWQSWRTNFLWTSLTYFAGAFGAGIVGSLAEEVGVYSLIAVAPIIVIVYLTYRTYLKNVEASVTQIELGKQHVEELNRFIAEQERIKKALVESEEHFRNAFDYAAIGMALVSPQGNWLRVNRSFCEIVGFTEAELLVSDFQAVTHQDDLGSDLAEMYRMTVGEILTSQVEKRYIHRLGHDVWVSNSFSLVRDSNNRPLHFIFQIQDITERKRAEAAIQTLSLADELTGLYNRRGFLAFCKQHLKTIRRTNKGIVMVYADLDGLKGINDSFGHKEGDRALMKAAELLKETFRSSDVLGRLGGDEFTILAAVDPDGGREKLLARLQEKFDDYNALRVCPYDLSISVGVAQLDPEASESMEDLLAAADAAMYENKRGKRDRVWRQPAPEPAAAIA